MSEKTVVITLNGDVSQISQTGFTSVYELMGVVQAAILQMHKQSLVYEPAKTEDEDSEEYLWRAKDGIFANCPSCGDRRLTYGMKKGSVIQTCCRVCQRIIEEKPA